MNRQLTALSGIAIALVVLHHSIDLEITRLAAAGITLPQDWMLYTLATLHRLGKVAVPLFLFISGSFLAYAARGNPPKLSWQTVQAALRRLLWPYLLWSMLFYLLVYLQRGEQYDVMGYLKNLLVGYPFHFVPLLLFFYAISVPLAAIAKRFGLALIVLLAVGQTLLLGVEYPGLIPGLPEWLSKLSVPALGETLAAWGIYFPLGLVYAFHAKRVQPWLARGKWLLLLLTALFFVLDVLHTVDVMHFPLAVHLYPFSFVLLMPLVKRSAIPRVEEFEYLGKRTYGLYLTHLLVVDLAILLLQATLPWLLPMPILAIIPIFLLALFVPLLMMWLLSSAPTRSAQRYVFG